MRLRVLDWLVCPVCGGELEVRNASSRPPVPSVEASAATGCNFRCHAPEPQRSNRSPGGPCDACYSSEIESALLVCTAGHSFPVRDGVPRLRIEDRIGTSESARGQALIVAASFEKEWSHFDYENDRTWHQAVEERCQLFL